MPPLDASSSLVSTTPNLHALREAMAVTESVSAPSSTTISVFVRGALELACGDLAHLGAVRVQAAGRVGDDDVDAAGLGRGDRVEDDRAGVAAGRALDDLDAGSARPRVASCSIAAAPGSVGRRDQHRQAQLLAQVPGELADRRRLAGAVEPTTITTAGSAVRSMRASSDRRVSASRLDQALAHASPRQLARSTSDPAADDLGRCRGPEVGQDQRLLEALEGLGVDPVGDAGRRARPEGPDGCARAIPAGA